MKWKQIFLIIAVSAVSALGSVGIYNKYFNQQTVLVGSAQNGYPVNYAGYFDGKTGNAAETIDLTKAAATAVPAVVHIKTKIPAKKVSNNLPNSIWSTPVTAFNCLSFRIILLPLNIPVPL